MEDYRFEELRVNLNIMRRSSMYTVRREQIETPSESGVHVYDASYRRYSVPAFRDKTREMLVTKSNTLKGSNQGDIIYSNAGFAQDCT